LEKHITVDNAMTIKLNKWKYKHIIQRQGTETSLHIPFTVC